MADNDYTIHDLVVSELPQFNPRGGVDVVKRAVFFIGVHGPFTKQYAIADYTAQKLADDIALEVAGLQQLDSLTQGTGNGS